MEDRVTISIEKLEPERAAALSRALADAFGLSEAEAEALLAADALVLSPAEARKLAALGEQLGIRVSWSATAPRRPRRGAWWLAVVGVTVLAALFAVVFTISGPRGGAQDVRDVRVATEAEDADTLIEPLPPGSSTPPTAPDLFTAARDLGPEEVRRALAAAPQVDLRDPYGQTPLMYAAGHNGAEVVALLLASGAQPNARSDAGWTPLMYAARNPDPGAAEALVAAGADPAARNDSGQSALEIALAYNNDAVSALLRAAQPETRPETLESAAPRDGGGSAAPPSVVTPTPAQNTPPSAGSIAITPRATPSVTPSVTSSATPSSIPEDPNRELIERCLADWESCGRE